VRTNGLFINALLVIAVAVVAAPALAFDGSDNPGIPHREAAPHNGDDNPGDTHGLGREEARALGRDECGEFKENFKENRSAFGKCVSAVAKTLRDESESARSACNAANLSHDRRDGEARSDFKACVLASKQAQHEAEQD